jgi:hypothetical protein
VNPGALESGGHVIEGFPGKAQSLMLWNLVQQMQLGRAHSHAMSLEERLEVIEERLERSKVLIEIISHLERRDGHGLDEDGGIG